MKGCTNFRSNSNQGKILYTKNLDTMEFRDKKIKEWGILKKD